MLKTKTWILLFLLFVLVCAALAVLLLHPGTGRSTVVQILQDGVCIREIDLAAVTEAYEFEVQDPQGGGNLVRVEPGRICIREADCPDRVCVRRGWLNGSGAPIVCLPHRLVIRAAEDGGLDAAAG